MGDFHCFVKHLKNGNTEEVKYNLKKEFLNKIVDELDNFPIHIACEKGFVDIVELILRYKCNIERENAQGMKPIHIAIQNEHIDVIELLCQHKCNIESENDDGRKPIHFAIQKENTEIVKLLLKNNCNIECDRECGMKPIHYASQNGNVDIVQLLLKYNCNIECGDYWGKRPIHYVCECGYMEILKLFLQKKCRFDCKTKNGQTPLDLAKQYNHRNIVKLLSRVENLFSAIKLNDPIQFNKSYESWDFISNNPYTELSMLEIAWKNNANRIIKYFLEKPVNNEEINSLMKELKGKPVKNSNFLKESILYRCIICQHVGGFKKFNTADVVNENSGLIRSSFLEIAAEQGCDVFIDEIMKKTIFDKSIWTKAINKAKKKQFVNIQEEISERMILLESRQKENLTILHTAIIDNDTDMVKYILDYPNFVDLNSNNETFGTALALAHALHHRKCIKILQSYQLNTNTQNKYLQTPLHEAIGSGVEEDCEYLIDQAIDIDQTGFLGLTSLHSAVIKGLINVCAQLVNKGADYVRYVELSRQSSQRIFFTKEIIIPFAQSIIPLTLRENALTLSMKFHGTLFPCFIDKLCVNNSNIYDGDNNSLLHMAVRCVHPDICRSLLESGANVNNVNNFGNTPLLEMFHETQIIQNDCNINKMINIVNILVEFGADVNAKSSNGITVFQYASEIRSEKLMLALVSNNPNLNNFSPNDLQLAFSNQWFEYAEILIKLLPNNFLSSNITNDILLHMAVKGVQPGLCRLLLNAGANVNNVNNEGNTPLLDIFYDKQIIQNNENFNKLIDMINLLIEYGADINIKSSNGISVFQSASIIENEKLMIALVCNNRNLNNFSPNDFQLAFSNQWFEYAEILIKFLPDNFLLSNISNETFQQCIKAEFKLIKLLFDKSNSDLQQSILENLLYFAVSKNDNDLFDHLIKVEILVPRDLDNGETLLTFILKQNKIQFAWKLIESINKLKYLNLKNRAYQSPLQVAIEIEEISLIDALIYESDEVDCEDVDGKTALSRLIQKVSIANNKNLKKFIAAIKTIIVKGGDIYRKMFNSQRVIDLCTENNVKEEIEEFYRLNVKLKRK